MSSAKAVDESDKQTHARNASGMKRKQRPAVAGSIEFLRGGIVAFFVQAGLLTALTAIQFRAEPGTALRGAAASLRLTQGSSWIWRSRQAVSQRRSSPTGFLSPAEDALKRRVTESRTLLRSPEIIVERYLRSRQK